MDTRFGGSTAGLLQRLRTAPIGVADLREVAERVLPTLAAPGLRVDVVARSGAGSLVVLEEDERSLRVQLGDLAEDMTAAGVQPTSAGIRAALSSWVAHRPVTDAAAASAGVAVLDWAGPARSAVAWRVVVRRGDLALPWAPSPRAGTAQVRDTRAAATARSADVPLDLRVEGPVALWSHPVVPALATTVLAAPRRVVERIAGAGLPVEDLQAVVTPHRPVACAEGAVATRLAGETTEACLTLPWAALPGLPWL